MTEDERRKMIEAMRKWAQAPTNPPAKEEPKPKVIDPDVWNRIKFYA